MFYLGVLIIFLVFTFIFCVAAKTEGFINAVLVFLGAFSLMALIWIAELLMHIGRQQQ